MLVKDLMDLMGSCQKYIFVTVIHGVEFHKNMKYTEVMKEDMLLNAHVLDITPYKDTALLVTV